MVSGSTSPARSAAGLPFPLRAVLAGSGVAAMLFGLWLGLVRLGFEWAVPSEGAAAVHGALMVCGFLGTVICIERATALGRAAAWIGPAAGAVGAVLLVLSALDSPVVGASVPRVCFLVEAAALAGASVAVLRRQPEMFNGVALAAALVFVTANVLWLAGRPIFQIVPWWAGFVVLTIAAERLELSRVTRPSRAAVGAFLGIALLLGGVLIAQTFRYAEGLRACGGVFLLFAVWLLRYDIARRTIRMKGLTRYIAAGLLSGYVWLAVAGILALAGQAGGLGRDAFYHAIFLGFAMSMIFAHAPVIVPAVAGVPVAWTRAFWIPLCALHGGLFVRVAADLQGEPELRSWAGLANAASILLFVLVLGRGAWSARVSASGR